MIGVIDPMCEEEICPRCKRKPHPGCDGWGNIPTGDSVARECPNMRVARVARVLGPEIRRAQHLRDSSLVGMHDENLFIRIDSWESLLPHLKASLGFILLRKAFKFEVITDQRIKSVFVGEEAYRARPLDERNTSQYNNGLTDLTGHQDLVILRLGFLGHTNKAAPGAVKEALMIRQAANLPTWIIEAEQKFEECFCYSSELANYIDNNYGLVELSTGKKAVPATAIVGMELEEDGYENLELDVESSPVVSLSPPSDPKPRGRRSFEEEDADVLAMEELLGSSKRKKK